MSSDTPFDEEVVKGTSDLASTNSKEAPAVVDVGGLLLDEEVPMEEELPLIDDKDRDYDDDNASMISRNSVKDLTEFFDSGEAIRAASDMREKRQSSSSLEGLATFSRAVAAFKRSSSKKDIALEPNNKINDIDSAFFMPMKNEPKRGIRRRHSHGSLQRQTSETRSPKWGPRRGTIDKSAAWAKDILNSLEPDENLSVDKSLKNMTPSGSRKKFDLYAYLGQNTRSSRRTGPPTMIDMSEQSESLSSDVSVLQSEIAVLRRRLAEYRDKIRDQQSNHIQERLGWQTQTIELQRLRRERDQSLEEHVSHQIKLRDTEAIAEAIISENEQLRSRIEELEEITEKAVSGEDKNMEPPVDWHKKLKEVIHRETKSKDDKIVKLSTQLRLTADELQRETEANTATVLQMLQNEESLRLKTKKKDTQITQLAAELDQKSEQLEKETALNTQWLTQLREAENELKFESSQKDLIIGDLLEELEEARTRELQESNTNRQRNETNGDSKLNDIAETRSRDEKISRLMIKLGITSDQLEKESDFGTAKILEMLKSEGELRRETKQKDAKISKLSEELDIKAEQLEKEAISNAKMLAQQSEKDNEQSLESAKKDLVIQNLEKKLEESERREKNVSSYNMQESVSDKVGEVETKSTIILELEALRRESLAKDNKISELSEKLDQMTEKLEERAAKEELTSQRSEAERELQRKLNEKSDEKDAMIENLVTKLEKSRGRQLDGMSAQGNKEFITGFEMIQDYLKKELKKAKQSTVQTMAAVRTKLVEERAKVKKERKELRLLKKSVAKESMQLACVMSGFKGVFGELQMKIKELEEENVRLRRDRRKK